MAVQRHRLADRGQQLLRDRRQLGGAGVAFEDDDELVAAQARDQVVLAHRLAQPLRHRLEQLVAGAVAERVVDRLEAVEVDEVDRERRVVAPAARDRAIELGQEHVAVGQAGQAVEARQLVDLFLGLLGQRHVAADAAVAGEGAGVVEHRLAADAQVTAHAVGAGEAVGEVAVRLARVDRRLIRGDRFGGRLEARVRHAAMAEQDLGREARDRLDAFRDVGEAEVGVLLPDPVRRQLEQARQASFAQAQRLGAIAHARLEQVAVGAHRRVQVGHLGRRQVLRALEQIALEVVLLVGAADALQQLAPRCAEVGRARVDADAAQLALQQRVERHSLGDHASSR